MKGHKIPLLRIDVTEGVSKDIKKQIHSKVREVKYDYVSIRES